MSTPTRLLQALIRNRMYLSFWEAQAQCRRRHPFLPTLKKVRMKECLRISYCCLLSRLDSKGYHIYSSVATSDGVGEDTLEPATLSSSANNDLLSDSLLDSTYTAPLSSEQASTSFNYNENGMNSVDTDSSDNCQMAPTTNAAGSIDSGHRGLIPTIGTTPKFTHKWPRPGMLKYLDSQSTSLHYTSIGIVASNSRGAAATSLEEGQGLGMSHIASWTTFKWLLLTSVMTVFTYGCAGLIMAIMTWFNGEQSFI